MEMDTTLIAVFEVLFLLVVAAAAKASARMLGRSRVGWLSCLLFAFAIRILHSPIGHLSDVIDRETILTALTVYAGAFLVAGVVFFKTRARTAYDTPLGMVRSFQMSGAMFAMFVTSILPIVFFVGVLPRL
jgi:hypothetical protein